MREFVQRQRQAREYDEFLQRKVEMARTSMRAGQGRSNDEVEGKFVAQRTRPRARREGSLDTGSRAGSCRHLGLYRRRQPICRCPDRSEEHTSELQSLMRSSYAVFCLKKNNNKTKR